MPNATTTVKTMDLNLIFYVLLFHFQRWRFGGLDGFYPYGSVISSCQGKHPNLYLEQMLFSMQGSNVVYH